MLLIVRPSAQQTGAPRSAAPSPAVSGTTDYVYASTGVLRGRVVAAESGAPIAGAAVRVMQLPGSQSVTTDATGRFEIRHLPAASYLPVASAPGYVPVTFGQRAIRD